MAKMTTNFELDDKRVDALLSIIKKPLSVEAGKRNGRSAWILKDASGREIKLHTRGMMVLISKAINAYEA